MDIRMHRKRGGLAEHHHQLCYRCATASDLLADGLRSSRRRLRCELDPNIGAGQMSSQLKS
jgi:hypothetical protein